MATVDEGDSLEVTVTSGKIATISTSGEAYIDRVTVLPDAGYSSDRLIDGSRTYGPADLDFIIGVRAISGYAECVVGYPDASSADVKFHRDDAGMIDALVDSVSGNSIPLGGSVAGVAVPDATEGAELDTINGLLASLRTAGIIAT